jgi:hypothetical protein
MSDWITLFLLIFVVYRLSQLIALDEICEPIRTYLAKRANENKLYNWIATLVHCPHCMGIWFAIPAALFFVLTSSIMIFYTNVSAIIMVSVTWLGIAGAQSFLQSWSSSGDN